MIELDEETIRAIDLQLRHYEGSWASRSAFVRSAVDAYIQRGRPDYIGPQAMPFPEDWPWPPDPANPEHAKFYDFSQSP